MNRKIAIVGGCNVDLSATTYTPLILQDSNPGRLKVTLGGVGRNIAENLARLGFETHLLSPLGDDRFVHMIQENARETGLDLSHCLIVNDMSTSSYLCINHPNGDIAVAVASMDICEEMKPAFLETQMAFLNACDAVIMDTNLPADTIAFLAKNCTTKLCADTVSSKKAEKLRGALDHMYMLKANRAEAAVLVGMDIHDLYTVKRAAMLLHDRGVQNVIITLSEDGAFVSNGKQTASLPPYSVKTVNSTGCGDAFFAGAMLALSNGGSAEDVARYGLAMAAISAGSESAVSPMVSSEAIQNVIQEHQEADI